jgi:2C-methyl-D-erythritol 2,4-cyclodiphosphate synthase
MRARMDANTRDTLATKEERADREQRKAEMEEIQAKMSERMTATQTNTGGKIKELTETIEKILVELQTVEASLYMEARKLQENLEVIEADLSTDTTMVGIEVKTTRKDALTQHGVLE